MTDEELVDEIAWIEERLTLLRTGIDPDAEIEDPESAEDDEEG